MATFNYSTITAAQALGITAGDTLVIDQGPANATTVFFVAGPPETVNVNVGAATVVFGTGLASATISYADGSRLYVGTPGADAPAAFPASNDGMYGGAGNDTLLGGDGVNQLQGNQGADSLVGGAGRDVIYGGQDNDTIRTGASAGGGGIQNFAQGNRGDDVLIGSQTDSDILLGGQGNDLIGAASAGSAQFLVPGYAFYLSPTGFTGGGDDFIIGNLGNDILFAGSGNDNVSGEDGDDFIYDVGGNNTLSAGAGNDSIVLFGQNLLDTGAGNDVVAFGGGASIVVLGDGDDLVGSIQTTAQASPNDRLAIDGGAGNDAMTGSAGIDTLVGAAGDDTIDGGASGDGLDGGVGNDVILAGSGVDTIIGGAGDDTVDGGAGGGDVLAGGDGRDVFQYFGNRDPTSSDPLDSIVDWSADDRLAYFDNAGRGLVGGTSGNYVEATNADYAGALAFANTEIAKGVVNYVAVQVGADTYVFADSSNNNATADAAVRLVGRSLADITSINIGLG